MKSIGRPKNPCFDILGFKLLRDKRKYSAECLVCGTELKNSASVRLLSHRRICKPVAAEFLPEVNNSIAEPDTESNQTENKYIQHEMYRLPIIVGAKTISQDDEIEYTVPKKFKRDVEEQPVNKHLTTKKLWTPNSTSLFLDFLKDAGNIQKPTPKNLYENFLRKNPNTKATWEQFQLKLQNIHGTYIKAKEWKSKIDKDNKSNETHPNEPEIWPYFYELEKIFGDWNNENFQNLYSNGKKYNEDSCPPSNNSEENDTVDVSTDSVYEDLISVASDVSIAENDDLHGASETRSVNLPSQNNFATKRKSIQTSCSNTRIKKKDDEDRMDYLNRKIKLEERRLDIETKYRQEKMSLKLEIKKLEIEERIRLKEIEERIRLREIEKEENIAKYEIKMKYSCNNGAALINSEQTEEGY